MDAELAQELVNELGSSMESLEAQHGALLQFLKDKGVVTDEEFGPYLERAAKSTGVRWRAARARLDHLLEAEKREAERAAEKEKEPKGKKPADEQGEKAQKKEGAKLTALDEEAAAATEGKDGDKNEADGEKDKGQKEPAEGQTPRKEG